MANRAAGEIQMFFIAWGVALAHALLRPAKMAWREQWWLAALGLALLPVLNAATTERSLWRSLGEGDWVFAGADLLFLLLAALHATLAVRIGQAKPRNAAARSGAPERRRMEQTS